MDEQFYPDDFTTPTWRKVEAHLEGLLERARAELEGPGLDEKPVALVRLRTRIALLKDLLALPTRGQAEDPDD